MKKFLRGFALSIVLLMSLVIGSVSTLWFFPHLVLTQDRTVALAQKFVGDLFSTFPTELSLKLSNFGWNGKRIHLVMNRFCLKEPEGCFEKADLQLGVKITKNFKVKIVEFGPAILPNESLTIHTQKAETPTEESSGKGVWDYVRISKSLKVSGLNLSFPQVSIQGKDSTIQGDLSISGERVEELNLVAHAKSTDGLTAEAKIQTTFVEGSKSPFHAQIKVKQQWSIDANLDGEIRWDHFTAQLNGKVAFQNLIPWVSTFELNEMKLTYDQTLKLDSNVLLKLEPKLSVLERDSALPKAKFSTEVRGKFKVEEKDENYDYTFHLGPLTDQGLDLAAELQGSYPFPEKEEYRFGLKQVFVKLAIPEFQSLVSRLKNTNSAIPAPFSSLKGNLLLQMGDEKKIISADQIPLALKTDLSSPEQAIKTQSDGQLVFKKDLKNIQLTGNTVIHQFKFTLPNFDPIAPQPAIKRDSRIKSIKEIEQREKRIRERKTNRKSGKSSFDFDWKVDSKPGAISLHYVLLKPFAGADVHLTLNNKENTGQIKVRPLDISYLSRDAHVEYFNYSLGTVPSAYQGRLVIQKTEYTIYIDVFESSGKPKVEFTSDPPLEESDIISVLLFNQTSQELTPDESNSVNDTQSAVANRALGLFSVWALSSTPIEAVSYNPGSGVYSARIKLANGLTATIGTDWDKTQEVAFRKRIGKNWVLSTIFEQDTETDEKTTKTLLEWFRRF